MAVTINDIMNSMISRLASTDPTISTALGTPQRKILDAAAAEIYSYVNDTSLSSTIMSIDAYSGTDLDKFCAMFGFTRQQAKSATGYVTVTRDNGDAAVSFSYATQFYKPADTSNTAVYFQASNYALLPIGQLSVDIPIIATTQGSIGNVNAKTIVSSGTIGGYYAITNPSATTGGQDAETDAAFRTRFLNTIFRNVSGTKDQYMALVLAAAANSRANLMGMSSRWAEVGTVEDDFTVTSTNDEWASILDTGKRLWVNAVESTALYVNGSDYTVSTSGGTTAPKVTFRTHDITATDGEYLVFNGKNASLPHSKIVMNAVLEAAVSTAAATVAKIPDTVLTVSDYSVVKIVFRGGSASATMTITATDNGTASAMPCMFPGAVATAAANGALYFIYHGGSFYHIQSSQIYAPSVTLALAGVRQAPWYYSVDTVNGIVTANAYWSAVGSLNTTLTTYLATYSYSAVNKGDFVNIEYDYVSNIKRNGTKAVDLYVDGETYVSVSDLGYFNTAYKMNTFQNVSSYQRDDGTTPLAANYFVPLSYQPIYHSNGLDTPNVVNYGTGLTLSEGTDFWYVHDISNLRGSVRAQDGIEIKASIVDTDEKIKDGYPLNIPYLYNNVPYLCQDLVSAQTTVATDVLVHESARRYFTICVAVMYSAYPKATVQARIKAALTSWANSLSFGAWVQMSDIQSVVASAVGVDNARIATTADSLNDYGIIEFFSDGETPVSDMPHTSDFRLRQNEIFTLQDVIMYSRTQEKW